MEVSDKLDAKATEEPGVVLKGTPRPRRTAGEVRKSLLDEGTTSVAISWTAAWRSQLHQEGRPAAGGWPGTLPEARARVNAYFLRAIHEKKMGALTSEELEWATRAVYAQAKAQWLAGVEREPSDPC